MFGQHRQRAAEFTIQMRLGRLFGQLATRSGYSLSRRNGDFNSIRHRVLSYRYYSMFLLNWLQCKDVDIPVVSQFGRHGLVFQAVEDWERL
jgi:hypothetical protein